MLSPPLPKTPHPPKPTFPSPLSNPIPMTGNRLNPMPLDQTRHVIAHLLHSTLSTKPFTGRWQVIRSKLLTLSSSISEISESPHWLENHLLTGTLLPSLLSTLSRLNTLHDQCSGSDPSLGKLLMQSDLDMASNWLSKHIVDIDIVIRSGVLNHSNAIVLSDPTPSSSKDELELFIRDLFTRIQIGGTEFKKIAMEKLLKLIIDDEKAAIIAAKQGKVSYLIQLMDLNTVSMIREQAVAAVSILARAGEESRRAVFEEGGLGPLLKMMENGSVVSKEKAAMAVAAITSDPENAWAVSAYGGVSILIEACRSGSTATQAYAAGAIENVCVVADVLDTVAEEGGIPILCHLLVAGNSLAKEKAAGCITILARTRNSFCDIIIRENGLSRLVHLLHECTSRDTSEHVLRALQALSVYHPSCNKVLSCSTAFLLQLAEFIKNGDIAIQYVSANLVANLDISEGNKRGILSSCMGALLKLVESSKKPEGIQEVALTALLSILSVRSNRKEFVKDEKCLMRLVQMLDPKYYNDGVSKGFAVAVILAVMAGGSKGCRRRLVAAGAAAHLGRLAEMEVAGAKKAAVKLNGNRLKSLFVRTWRELPRK